MLRPSPLNIKLRVLLAAFALASSGPALAGEACDSKDDFPTAVIADYVLGCMAANGNNYESLHKCSCSIDFIKSRMSYSDYEKAQTVMSVKHDRGQRGIFFRESTWAKNALKQLERVQSESTLRCF